MKHLIIVGNLALSLFAISAHADEGTPDIDKVDAQFTSMNPLPPYTLIEAKKLRAEAFAHCEAGETQQGLALLAQAKQLLGIE